MRFTISTTFLVLFLAIFGFAFATKIMDSDSIQNELTHNYLIRRADDDTTSSKHGSASSSGHGSATTDATATASSSSNAEAAASTTATTKKKNTSTFAAPEILQTGTLFYIGISVTTLLWITGKAIDIQTNRQERYAESLVHSI